MNVIVKCPNCGRATVVRLAPEPVSEVIRTDKKTCLGCNKELTVEVRIVVQIKKAVAKEA